MGLKFRKRITLFPGCTVNFSKSGISTTLGAKGFSVNVGKRGTFLNAGIPGTGLYDRIRLDSPSHKEAELSSDNPPSSRPRRRQTKSNVPPLSDFDVDGNLPSTSRSDDFSSKYSPIPQTSAKWLTIKSALARSQKTRAEYRREEQNISERLVELRKPNVWTFFGGGRKERVAEETVELEKRRDFLRERLNALDSLRLRDLPIDVLEAYRRLSNSFRDVCRCRAIWSVVNESVDELASTDARFVVDFRAEATTELDPTFNAFQMKNAQGDSIYFYPSFLLLSTKEDFALVDFADLLAVSGTAVVIREFGFVPSDAKIVDVEQIGASEIKSAQYFSLSITSKQGLDETFVFSALEPARRFCGELANYRRFCTSRHTSWN